jgi:hypothetical protein
MNYEEYKKLSPEEQRELQEIELQKAELRGERRALLNNLHWDGMTDEEVTWLYNRQNGGQTKFLFIPTLAQIRQMIADEKANG